MVGRKPHDPCFIRTAQRERGLRAMGGPALPFLVLHLAGIREGVQLLDYHQTRVPLVDHEPDQEVVNCETVNLPELVQGAICDLDGRTCVVDLRDRPVLTSVDADELQSRLK